MTRGPTKHVWILNHYAQEPGGPGATRHFSLARHLPNHGWTASIIAASVVHGTGHDRLAAGERHRLDRHDDVPFLWLKTSTYSRNDLKRVRNMLEYCWQVSRVHALGLLARPDAVVGSSVHPFAALAGWHVARRLGVPFLFEVRDLWPQTLIDLGRLDEHSAVARAMRQLETFLYRRACRVITPLPRAVDYISARGVPADRVVWISNGADLKAYPATPYPPDGRPSFELMYIGAHGLANSLETLIDAMRIVEAAPKPRPIRLRMIGDGPAKAMLKARAAALGLTCVSFDRAVPKSAVPALAADADALVVCLRDLPRLYRFGISLNKLFDDMAAARPVVIASAAINNPIADAGCGLTVAPERPDLLAKAILAMSELPRGERERMGLAGRRLVERDYSYDQLAARLAKTLDACCKTGA